MKLDGALDAEGQPIHEDGVAARPLFRRAGFRLYPQVRHNIGDRRGGTPPCGPHRRTFV